MQRSPRNPFPELSSAMIGAILSSFSFVQMELDTLRSA